MKNNDWGFIDSNGKKASGQQVLNFIKEAFCSRLGFIYEYKRAYKYVGFADSEDFMEWYNLVLETIDSKNPEIIENNLSYSKIVEVWELPKSGVGYIWEGGVDDGEDYYGKFFGFIDEDKYNEWVEEGRPLVSDLIQQSWVSFRPRIVALEGLRDDLQHDNQQFLKAIELSNLLFLELINLSNLNFKNEINLTINNNVLGYIYEDHEHGKFLGFATEETYNEWHNSGESPLSNLILLRWNNSKEQGIPIYTKSWADNLADTEGDYIVIPDEDDVNNSSVENHTYDTSINGPLANILFSAIRQLLSEITKIKNSFDYGLYSYTGTNTAMSKVLGNYSSLESWREENEPLWAIDEQGLSLISELYIGPNNNLTNLNNVNSELSGVLFIQNETSSWDTESLLSGIEDPKVLIYITSNNFNIKFNIKNLLSNQTRVLDLNLLNFEGNIGNNLYSVLTIFTNTTKTNSKNFIWISIKDINNDTKILEGYLNLDNYNLTESPKYLSNSYIPTKIDFTNIRLSKCNLYSKYQDFSEEVISSTPSEENYRYKVAHITIRSVDTYNTLDSIKNQLPENELIFVEDTKKLYIKNKFVLVPIASGGSEEGGNHNQLGSGMEREEILQMLEEMGITTDNSGKINFSEITFVHQETGIKFNLEIDSEGNLKTTKITDDSLAKRIKAAFNNEESIGTDSSYRGFIGRLRSQEYTRTQSSANIAKDVKLYSDRLKIGAFYAPSRINKTFGCSHCFVELENTSNIDIPLEGCYLHYLRGTESSNEIFHLALTGVIPAGGTYLVRGAKKSEFDDVNTFIKVKTFDQEWYINNNELIDFSHNGRTELVNSTHIGTEGGAFALTYGKEDLAYNDYLWENNTGTNKSDAKYLYPPYYIDSICFNRAFTDNGGRKYWAIGSADGVGNIMSYIKGQDNYPDAIYRNTFELDPAKLAFLSLNGYDSSRYRHQTTNDYLYLYLGKEFIEFPHSEEKCPISKFTPKASYEHKNVCTDKTQLDIEKPNMVTCSFGKNPYTTRCFNWVSGGLFDEYVFIKQGSTWIKFESYKEGDESKTLESGALKRKEFNNADIINYIYKRMTGRFPAANTLYTAHKCIINITTDPVNAPTEYTYVVGRADKNGNPDLEHCSEEYTFTLYPTSYTPRIYLTTDLQGFHWVEYQTWAAAANVINNLITTEVAGSNIIPVLVNTGDMTQSGARINEWLDYYNAGKPLFRHLELMNVVGNNDLCGNNFTILGTGDDEGKANSYYFHVFYCYEVETEEGMIPIINNKYIPALYRIMFNTQMLLFVNSEITMKNCSGWFGATTSGGSTVNVYTGWEIGGQNATYLANTLGFTPIYTILYNMTDNLSIPFIALCHEMPFTVITKENLSIANKNTVAGDSRSLSRKGEGTDVSFSLVGSHLNLISNSDTKALYWFSRLLEFRKCKLCLGGHKHTYAITYPVMENYIYTEGGVQKRSSVDGPMTMTSTLENDSVIWTDTKNETNVDLSKFPLTLTGNVNGPDGGGSYNFSNQKTYFYPSEFVTLFPGTNNSGIVYFMCLATGFKLMSNKELPSNNQAFSLYLPKSNESTGKAANTLKYPMYSVVDINNNNYTIKLIRLKNIHNGVKLLTLIDYGTGSIQKEYLYDNSVNTDPNNSENMQGWTYGGWTTTPTNIINI